MVVSELLALDELEEEELPVLVRDWLVNKAFCYLARISEMKVQLRDYPWHIAKCRGQIKYDWVVLGYVLLIEWYMLNLDGPLVYQL